MTDLLAPPRPPPAVERPRPPVEPPPAEARPAVDRASWALAALIFAAAFVVRFLDPSFQNDHFLSISQGRQVVAYGELPVRDFIDPGFFLQICLSAAAQLLLGYNLLGEALVCIAFLALGAALTFLVGAHASGSKTIGALMAVLVVASYPRLYSYPKIFLHVFALVLLWGYVDRPSRRRLVAVGLATGFAFLVRHDHGVYVAAAGAVTLAALHWRNGLGLLARRLTVYAGVATLPVLPFLAFLQLNGGIGEYFGSALEYARSEARRQSVFPEPPFTIDRAAPLLRVEPPPPPLAAPIKVRWAEGVSAETRAELEQQYRLARAEGSGDDRPGRPQDYDLLDTSRSNVAALVRDRSVEDTDGIDRGSFQVKAARDEPPWISWQRAIPLLRLSIAPGIFRPANAVAWLYYLFVSLPAIAALVLLLRRRRHARERPPGELPKLLGAAVLCFLAQRALLRDPIEHRWADAVAPTAVLGAWLLGLALSGRQRAPLASRRGAFRFGRPRRPRFSPAALPRLAQAAAALAVVSITIAAVISAVDLGDQLRRSGLDEGPAAAAARLPEVVEKLATSPPIDAWAKSGAVGSRALARYVHECTKPTDKLLVTWAAPDLYFYSGRGFAAGRAFWFTEYHASPADQERTIERWRSQSVPIVIDGADREKFESEFDLVSQYLEENYRVARESDFGEAGASYRLFVDKRLEPTGTYPPLSLPCYK